MPERELFAAFISHSSSDARAGEELCALLESRGIPCWIAPRNVAAGREFAGEIMGGLAASASLVLLVSSHSSKSAHVLREVDQAVRLSKPVLPVLIEEAPLTRALFYYIGPLHWIEATPGILDKQADVIASAIRGDRKWKESGIAPSFTRKLRYRRDIFLASLMAGFFVVAALAGIAFLAWSWRAHVREAARDRSYLSLGFVSLTGKSVSGTSVDSVLTVYLYDPLTRYADVRLKVGGAAIQKNPSGDLSQFLDKEGIGAPQVIEFQLSGLASRIVTCLTMPHPHLKTPYRVTQVFGHRDALAGDVRLVDFSQMGDAQAAPEDGSPCQSAGERR